MRQAFGRQCLANVPAPLLLLPQQGVVDARMMRAQLPYPTRSHGDATRIAVLPYRNGRLFLDGSPPAFRSWTSQKPTPVLFGLQTSEANDHARLQLPRGRF